MTIRCVDIHIAELERSDNLEQVPRAKKASWKTLSLLLYRLILLLIWTILAFPGTILNGPMFIIASIISRRKAKGANEETKVDVLSNLVLVTS